MGEELIFESREEAETWAAAFNTFARVESEDRARKLADDLVWAMRERSGVPREGWKAQAKALVVENEVLIAALKAHGIEPDEIASSAQAKLQSVDVSALQHAENQRDVYKRQAESANIKLETERKANADAEKDRICKLVDLDREVKKARVRIRAMRTALEQIASHGVTGPVEPVEIMRAASTAIHYDDGIVNDTIPLPVEGVMTLKGAGADAKG